MTQPTNDPPGPSHQHLKAMSLMRMAGGLAHDFNNYLAAIQGNNELVIAAHLSTRYNDNQVKRLVQKALPGMLDGRLKLWL